MSGRASRIIRYLLGGLVAAAGALIIVLVAAKSGDVRLVPAIIGGLLMSFGAWLVDPPTLSRWIHDVGGDVRPWLPTIAVPQQQHACAQVVPTDIPPGDIEHGDPEHDRHQGGV